MKNRKYKNYDLYIEHQKTKTLLPKVQEIKPKKFKSRIKRFIHQFSIVQKVIKKGSCVLCLGARRGEEVIAFKKIGYNAIGIDLVAFPPHVISGDFHNLPFKNEKFSLVYSNAIDHVYDLVSFSKEVNRVVKKGGYVLFHLSLKTWSDEMSLGLKSSNEVSKYFQNFLVIKSLNVKPWAGGLNCILFMKKMR